MCGDYSVTVHHIKKLSQIRDDVLRSNPEINPFNSHAELRKFSDMVLAEHKEHLGCILCERCHDKEHNPESLRKMEIAITKEAILQWENSTKIIAGTGHRPHKLGKEYDLKGKYSTFLKEEITKAFDFLSPRKIISGMALGFDQLLAIIAIERNIPVIAAIPCDGQEKIWPESSQKLYHEILANPLVTQKIVSDGPYSSKKMGVRNEWMVNNSYAIIAAWDGSGGGTAACLKYAQTIENYLIYRIDPRDTLRK